MGRISLTTTLTDSLGVSTVTSCLVSANRLSAPASCLQSKLGLQEAAELQSHLPIHSPIHRTYYTHRHRRA